MTRKMPTGSFKRKKQTPEQGVVAFSTAPSRDEGLRLAEALVGERLAACVNVSAPLTSIYHWKDAVERADEVLLVIKTRRALVHRLATRIRELHSYEVPELIVLPIVGGDAAYLDWLLRETGVVRPPS